jgi:hypothetical protein
MRIAGGLIDRHWHPEVEVVRVLLEHRERVGPSRCGSCSQVPLVERDRRFVIDLVYDQACLRRPSDPSRPPNGSPARVDPERVLEGTGEQENGNGVLEDVGPVELLGRNRLLQVGSGRGSPSQDRHAFAQLPTEISKEQRWVVPSDRRHRDAQSWLHVGLAPSLLDGLSSGCRRIGGEARSQSGGDVHRVGGEQGERHRVLLVAQDGRHLPARRGSDELDALEGLENARCHGRRIGVVGGEQEAGLRIVALEPGQTLFDHRLDGGVGVHIVAVSHRHPKHRWSVPPPFLAGLPGTVSSMRLRGPGGRSLPSRVRPAPVGQH